jgi:TRAP-type C4-dicarboxylate transport system permease small subunit
VELFARINAWINRGTEALLAILGVAMAVVVAVQVVCRYLFNHSLFWSEEVARYLLVWLTFLGAAAAYYRRAHPGIDVLSAWLGPRSRRVKTMAVHLVCLGFFVVLIWQGAIFSHFVRLQISPALALPLWLVVVVIPVAGVILVCHCLLFLCRELRETGDDR